MDRRAMQDFVTRATDLEHYGFDTIRVKKDAFVPVVWAMVAFSFLFLPLRFWARWRTFRRFFSDDLFALLAWLCAVAIGALATYCRNPMYYTIYLTLEPVAPEDIDPSTLFTVRKFMYSIIISFMLMYTSLWCVKLSFLLFFYRLGHSLISKITWHWWSVTVFTLAAYGATFATYPYMSSFGSYEQVSSPYCTAEQNMSFVNTKLNTALDVVTDVLIMTIPLNILWRSKISLRQSLALGGVFSLVLVTITFAIVRATVSTMGVTKQWTHLGSWCGPRPKRTSPSSSRASDHSGCFSSEIGGKRRDMGMRLGLVGGEGWTRPQVWSREGVCRKRRNREGWTGRWAGWRVPWRAKGVGGGHLVQTGLVGREAAAFG